MSCMRGVLPANVVNEPIRYKPIIYQLFSGNILVPNAGYTCKHSQGFQLFTVQLFISGVTYSFEWSANKPGSINWLKNWWQELCHFAICFTFYSILNFTFIQTNKSLTVQDRSPGRLTSFCFSFPKSNSAPPLNSSWMFIWSPIRESVLQIRITREGYSDQLI